MGLWFHLANFLILLKGLLPFNTTILWSLAIEEQFYLLWPLLVFSIDKEKIIKFCIVYLIAAPFIRLIIFLHYPNIDLNVFTPTRLDGFMVGALLSISFWKGENNWIGLKKIVLISFVFSFAFLLLIMICNSGFLYHLWYFRIFGYLMISIFYGSLLYYSINLSSSNKFYKIFTNNTIKLVAKHSYVMYLVHSPLNWIFINQSAINFFFKNFLTVCLLSFLICF